MKISTLIHLTIVAVVWSLIFLVFLPSACSKEIANQDALNAQYSVSSMADIGEQYERF